MLSSLMFANNMIKRALETKTPLNPMKLQKLLYLLFARFIYKYDEMLFSNEFEKWPTGPVLPEIYDEFLLYGSKAISAFYRDAAGKVGIADERSPELFSCINDVWRLYGGYYATELSSVINVEGGAWSKAPEIGELLDKEDIKDDGKRLFP